MSKVLKNVALAVGGFVAGVLVTKAIKKEEEVFEYYYEDLSPEDLDELYSDLEEETYQVELTREEVEKLFGPMCDECDDCEGSDECEEIHTEECDCETCVQKEVVEESPEEIEVSTVEEATEESEEILETADIKKKTKEKRKK